ncbi:ribosomal protein S18 acetylase RimI-like enzyme [Caulobacter ginsengisoli]|uniref:Ribosomal protein S18 acetylase RimI-like enzyme n=1 Tax=Caulobacter ginsengisoli TaxID=400775 RepID=A0ABU0IUU3_9CAUL|nr:GNAT family N-acetyltransferase [Caulobacter ginsengisoli]MDQ0465790.1 ribosomal protein S18 acetylase RimI-like enzyme [Caulobacter ginsengisoli]
MSFTIRRLGPDEGPLFRQLRLTTLRLDEINFVATLAEEEAKPASAFDEAVRDGAVFVAEANGVVLGLVGLMPKTNAKERHKGLIYSVFVMPEGRGKGVGRALMTTVLDHARSVVESVFLVAVADNRAAVSLYESVGFESYGLEPRSLLVDGAYSDDLLMWKRLK